MGGVEKPNQPSTVRFVQIHWNDGMVAGVAGEMDLFLLKLL